MEIKAEIKVFFGIFPSKSVGGRGLLATPRKLLGVHTQLLVRASSAPQQVCVEVLSSSNGRPHLCGNFVSFWLVLEASFICLHSLLV